MPAPSLAAVLLLIGLVVGWTVAAGPAADTLQLTARQALDRQAYVGAVLGPDTRRKAGE